MKTGKYNDIVVGSGISGLTMALLLANNGRSVLLLEKSPVIGGSLTRFKRKGIPLDTGFHFTGGFSGDGILWDMLRVLGIHGDIQPLFINEHENNRIIFEKDNSVFNIPSGLEDFKEKLITEFPAEAEGIEDYFRSVRQVCSDTVNMDLRRLDNHSTPLKEEYITLQSVLNNLTANKRLQSILAEYSLCHGTRPSEVSFANHCRVSLGLYEGVARVKNGGEAFINAFSNAFEKHDISINTNTSISSFAEFKDRRAVSAVLSSGEEIEFDNCVFAIHPREILKILPARRLSRAFQSRINEFEPSIGFFSVYGIVDHDAGEEFDPSIISFFPADTLDEMFSADYSGDPPLVIIKSREKVRGREYNVINAFEIEFTEEVKEWWDSTTGHRPAGYQEYKEKRIARIIKRIFRQFPQYEKRFSFLEAASMLTFRDYLHSHDGTAYGIKQKVGQYNLCGRLPFRNLFAVGQNAILPGLMGAMMSSFIVARMLVGREKYQDYIHRRIG